MNVTFKVASPYECDSIHLYNFKYNTFDPTWKQSVIGCKILMILQHMYKFRFGFIIRRPDYKFYKTFYSKPFIRTVWNWLYFIATIVAILFYILKRWEYSILGGWECSFAYEVLMIIGAYCQHSKLFTIVIINLFIFVSFWVLISTKKNIVPKVLIPTVPPMDAKLPSRRIAYFIFFMFSYVVYTYYTSNLLSGLVNDHDKVLTLEMLADSPLEFVIVNYMQLSSVGSLSSYGHNISVLKDKLLHMRSVSVPEGLADVLENKVALLSDYATIYPYMIKSKSI
ncbi:uncharacterized protein LOC113503972 [Trichoplusia ni]|uniref:Uncharacterized protein LOC113503972 n=1 Tax=Trichoplusia ni TaxID=7111 RepID=A0A7E5WNK7_TRINI|nr:uncharacterized protein LOC113503972 [Trichoplusia ni]